MKRIKIASLIFAATFLFTACKKDTPMPESPQPSSVSLSSLFQSNLDEVKQTFTINANTTQTITGNRGTVMTFYPNSFETQTGMNVTGNITIELIEIYDKKSMILTNKPTVGKTWDGVAPLISGGEYNIVARQNGQILKLKNGANYQVIAPAPQGTTPEMELFTGEIVEEQLTWRQVDSSFVDGQGENYYALFDSLNWVNLDYFMNSGGPQSTLAVQLPSEYNHTNATVFVSVDGTNSIAALYTFIDNRFVSSYGYTLPIGMDVHFVVLATINDQLRVAVVPSTITADHLEIVSTLSPTTEADLGILLNTLP